MQYSDRNPVSEMAAALYRGAFESPRWDGFLQQLKDACGADLAGMGLSRPGPNYDGVSFWKSNREVGNPRDYGSYAELDRFTNLPNGEAITLHDISSQQKLEQSTCYQDWMLPNDYKYVLGMDIYREQQVAIYIRLTRGFAGENFGPTEKALLNALQPHFNSLLIWLDRLEELNSERSIYESVVSSLALGTVVIDSSCAIIKMNPVAEYLLSTGDELHIKNNHLACHTPSLNTSLQKLFLSFRSPLTPDIIDTLSIPRANTATPLYLSIKPHVYSEFSGDSTAKQHVVFINAAEMHVSGSQQALQDLLGLTKAEARVTLELANGLSVDEISDKLHISYNTVRTHISRIYQKTDVSKQVALVNLALRCIASLN